MPRIQYFKDLAVRVDETPEEDRSGKDWFALNREYQKLRRNFAGITEMERLPGAVFVVDPKREELLVKEANRLKIPVLALTDTNCDPEVVDYVIPGNDDAIRSISLISRLVADAIIEGRGEEARVEERPVPPVIEDATVEAEIQQTEPTTDATNATNEAPAPPVEATEEPPAADVAEGGAEAAVEPEVVAEPVATEVEEEAVEVEPDPRPEAATEIDIEAIEPEVAAELESEEPLEEDVEEPGPVEDAAPEETTENTEEN
jgi:small subunit ribosomal protein S2